MTPPDSAPALHRLTLANGLRVLFQPQPGVPRVAVAVHYGVGFRCEPPGREGFAHLFEHLMFRGSASLPGGRFYDHIHRFGGHANGSTHQDYTDYYQVAPAAALEQALFAEADRMRAPLFTPESLAEQLDGVEAEIRQVVAERPYGGFPWPLMSGAMYRNFAGAHDGFGDPEDLRRTTLDDCAEFFDTHYAPGNAVLTVVGGFDPEHARALVEKHFAAIQDRPFASPPTLHEPPLTEDRWTGCTEPGIQATALALGHWLPDPKAWLPEYLAHAALARMTSRYGRAALKLPSVSASCGFFGLLDARTPDPMIVTLLLPDHIGPRVAADAVSGLWRSWADDPGLEELTRRTVRGMAAEALRVHADIQTRARALGRLEILYGRAELLDGLPELYGMLQVPAVAEAARALAAAPKAALVLVPGERRTRPRPIPRPVPPTPQQARPVPGLGPELRPEQGDTCDTALGNGLRVVAVHEPRFPLVELRLRLPLGLPRWIRPAHTEAELRRLVRDTRAASRAEALGGRLTLSTDGEWAEITGYVPPSRAGAWLSLLAEVAGAGHGAAHSAPGQPPALRPRTPEEVVDDAVRTLWAGPATPSPAAEETVLSPQGGVLVAVGPLDGAEFTVQAQRALDHWTGAPPATVRPHLAGELLLRDPSLTVARFTVCAPERHSPADEAARFLATAAYAGSARSRVARRFADWADAKPREQGTLEIHGGRDVLLGTPRAYVRATVAPHRAGEALGVLREEAHRLATKPLTVEELAPVREFCMAQMLAAFDSPGSYAALLCRTVSSGGPPSRPALFGEELRAIPADAVAQAAVDLFTADAATRVLVRP